MATAVKTLQNFVAGDWVEATGDDAREIVSPVTGEKLADAPNASRETTRPVLPSVAYCMTELLETLRWPIRWRSR